MVDRRLFALALTLTSCSGSKLGASSGGLSVDPSSLVFAATLVGASRTLALHVANSAAGARDASVSVSGPFSAPAVLHVGGGAPATLAVVFTPGEIGDASGQLRFTTDGAVTVVALSGSAVARAACPAAPACQVAVYDAESNSCALAAAGEGSSCSASTCLQGATCVGGNCVGTPLDCDDGDACTLDACDATLGCVHQDASANCPAPADPCHVASCDPGSGCGTALAPDGTVCGAVSCTTANVCLLGRCVAVAPPDGFPCAPATPCQGGGSCQSQSCVQGAPEPMQPVWSLPASPGFQIDFPGLLDDHDDLYWQECGGDDGGCFLASATADGFLRYRAPLGHAVLEWHLPGTANFILQGDQVILGLDNGQVVALAQADGSLRWSAAPPPAGANGPCVPAGLAEIDAQSLAVRYAFSDHSALAVLEAADGGLRDELVLGNGGNVGSGLVVDASGTAWAAGGLAIDGRGTAALGFNRQATIVAALPISWSSISAALGNTLVLPSIPWQQELLLPDGGIVPVGNGGAAPQAMSGLPERSPVGAGQAAYLANTWNSCTDGLGPCGQPLLTAFDTTTGAVLWTSPDAGPWTVAATQPELAEGGAILLATSDAPEWLGYAPPSGPPSGEPALAAYDGAGNLLFSCAIGNPESGDGDPLQSALGHGRWFDTAWGGSGAVIRAYDVPGLQPAAHGWVNAGGTPGQAGHPR